MPIERTSAEPAVYLTNSWNSVFLSRLARTERLKTIVPASTPEPCSKGVWIRFTRSLLRILVVAVAQAAERLNARFLAAPKSTSNTWVLPGKLAAEPVNLPVESTRPQARSIVSPIMLTRSLSSLRITAWPSGVTMPGARWSNSRCPGMSL